jgi:mono/diheme cytochrome c family protein
MTLILVAAIFLPARADELAPFVIGFERFGRHDEIEPSSAGRLLLTELSCTACHSATSNGLKPKSGPSLAGAGIRMQASWIEGFLDSPSTTHRRSTMPNMLASLPADQRKIAARALTAYLMSLVEPFPEPKASGANPIPLEFPEKGDSQQGKRLFHTVGCVACHEPDADYDVPQVQPSDLDKMLDTLDPEELKELGLSSSARKVDSIPLPKLAEKYTRKSLTYFLLYPEHVRQSSRMPGLHLKPVEAADIAAYLIPAPTSANSGSRQPTSNRSPQMIAQGRSFFTDLRCANCHQVSSTPSKKTSGTIASSKTLASLKLESPSSCVTLSGATTAGVKRGQPIYRLDPAQINALKAALLQRQAPPVQKAELQLQLLQLNCYACHERDELGGVDRYRKPYFETVNNIDIGDEGRLPPTLTGVGKRLNSAWMEKVLAGEGAIRPHMTIRMPVYGKSVVKPLPAILDSLDRTDKAVAGEAFVKGDRKMLAEAGRQLMDAGCVQCHSFRGHALPGVVGVDLSGIETRVQPKWLHDFMLDPGSLKPRTRMPSFFPEGKSQNSDILGGNIEQQLAAMAAYLSDLKNQPLPQKIEEARAQSFELMPVDKPIVLRTFMPVGGLHSIAVGFPEKWHFAFDAERCSVAEAWCGKFLDAETTWFDRFAKPVQPLGNKVISFPSGPAISLLAQKNAAWPTTAPAAQVQFKGYELDSKGIPTFRYEVSEYSVTDRLQPQLNNGAVVGLHRKLIAKGLSADSTKPQLWFRALADKRPQQVTERPANSSAALVASNGLTVILISNMPFGEVRNMAGQTEWIIPFKIEADQTATIEMLYQWK